MSQQGKRGVVWWIIAVVITIAILFGLLVVAGWLFLAGIGGLLIFGYTRTRNRGLLTAGGAMLGVAVGVATETFLGREGGVPMAAGLGVGLLAVFAIDLQQTGMRQWWWVAVGVILIAVTALLWSATMDELRFYLTALPFIILLVLGIALIQFLRERPRKKVSSPS